MSGEFLPSYLLIDDLQYHVVAKLMGKTEKQKNLVHLFTVKSTGVVPK